MFALRILSRFECWISLICFMSFAWCGTLQGAVPSVEIVTGAAAPELERLAAKELADLLHRLFAAEVSISTKRPAGGNVILLGSPATNPAVGEATNQLWPILSKQGQLLRTTTHRGQTVLVVGGGSPQATLWAVYELGHRFGMRSLLQGDFLPVEPPSFSLENFNVVIEPRVHVRAWQTLDGGSIGWEAWGLTDHQRILRQLVKQRFNRIVLAIPAAHFDLKGTAAHSPQRTGKPFSGPFFRVDGDTAGRKAFGGARWFANPDLSEPQDTDDKRLAAERALVRKVIDFSHELGFSVAIRLAPLTAAHQTAPQKDSDNSDLLRSTVELLHSCLATYPQVDALHLVLPTESTLAGKATELWKDVVLSNEASAKRVTKLPVEIQLVGAKPTLMPVEFCSEDLGVLPQMMLTRLLPMTGKLRDAPLDGWIIHCCAPSDGELGVYYLSRAAFEPQLDPAQTAAELITNIAGVVVAERLLKGFQMVEKATEIIQQNAPKFAAVSPNMVIKHASPVDAIPPWWTEVRNLYTEAMNEMYRGNTRAREGGRDFILYYARRYEFGLTYMSSLESLRQATIAKSKKDRETQSQQLETSVEAMYNALGAFSEVARDPSDRGVIAVLNEFGYRPLMRELQSAEEAQ